MIIKRKCIVTRQVLDRQSLFKVVKDKDNNISIDLSYNKPGRGAYISKDINVIETAKNKDALSRALKGKVDKTIYDELINLVKGELYGKE